jgi:hypothetical protein
VIPKAGTALLRRLLFFEARFDMAQFSRLFGHIEPIDTATLFRLDPGTSVKKVRNCLELKTTCRVPCRAPTMITLGTRTSFGATRQSRRFSTVASGFAV